MRWLAPMAVLALTCCAHASRAEDDLFSDIAVESVFATRATTTENAPAPGRVTSAAQLADLLRRGGLEPERTNGKTVLVNVVRGAWKLPTVVAAKVDRDRIEIAMGLVTRKDTAGWRAEKLIDLLAAEPDASGAYFSLDRDRGQLQLRRALASRGLTSDRLIRALEEMAELALARENAWNLPGAAPQTASASVSPTETRTSAPALASLEGSWVASLSQAEAFAVRFVGGRFALAHVRNGQTTTSKGTATQSAGELRLAGSGGVSLSGKLSNVSAAGFDLTFTGGKRLRFERAKK